MNELDYSALEYLEYEKWKLEQFRLQEEKEDLGEEYEE
jgi:hypothetical protein